MPSESQHDSLWSRVDEHIREGRLWRAKEILRGNITARGYDPALFERYGQVLLRLGDQMEAGKYLFLSGRRMPEYEAPIGLFLGRCNRGDWKQLYRAFPATARLARRDAYPAVVAQELAAFGLPEQLAGERSHALPNSRIGQALIVGGCLTLFAFAVAAFLIGVAVILRAVFD